MSGHDRPRFLERITEDFLGSLDIKSKTVFLYWQGKCVLICKHFLRIERNHGFWVGHFPSVHRNLMSKDPSMKTANFVKLHRLIHDPNCRTYHEFNRIRVFNQSNHYRTNMGPRAVPACQKESSEVTWAVTENIGFRACLNRVLFLRVNLLILYKR